MLPAVALIVKCDFQNVDLLDRQTDAVQIDPFSRSADHRQHNNVSYIERKPSLWIWRHFDEVKHRL